MNYAERQKYHFAVSGLLDKDRHPAWSKILAWTALLEKYSWVFQVDLDTAFMNFDVRLETFLDDRYDVIVARDCYVLRELQEPDMSFNTGAMFLKSSPWTLGFLAKVWALNGTDVPNIRLWWEQAAIMHALRLDPTARQHVKIVPGRQFNAWPFQNRKSWRDCDHGDKVYAETGDFLVHVPGPDKDELLTPLRIANQLNGL